MWKRENEKTLYIFFLNYFPQFYFTTILLMILWKTWKTSHLCQQTTVLVVPNENFHSLLMVRELSFTAGLTALIVLVFVHKTCSTENNIHQFAPSSCGNIQNISNPLWLTSDPKACGDLRYELSCENNRTVLYLFEGKYYVQEINNNNYTIWVVDSGIQKDNYFSTPSYSFYQYNFSSQWSSLSYDWQQHTDCGFLELWKTSEYSILFGYFYLQWKWRVFFQLFNFSFQEV